MLTRFRIRPIVVAIAGGIALSLAALWGLGHLGHAPAGNVDVVAPPVMVQDMRQTPIPMPLSVAARTLGKVSSVNETANITHMDVPLPIVHPPAQPSQLIRSSTLGIEVKDVSRAVHIATGIVAGELGDVVNLDYRAGGDSGEPKTAILEVRVPQYRFNHALDELSALGRVTSRAESAQDAAGQIVDGQARLRNLRHTEADILKIMDRYGDIEQVLRVTQELSNVREQIESLDAQLKGMQYQVAYSTITISFATPAAVADAPGSSALLGKTWDAAVAALKALTVSVLSFGLWVVAFSPYVALLVLAVLYLRRRMRVQQSVL